eukprot:TRINITY_DN6907_c0_g1_i5.p1 TRINITY_DN6907_c0_g1~~TRINITY_DN6907_c0_g1_i5.p1  ORF type:complete len:425 (+),score=72.59 TRINITY_DN6907_c0_g1_i5:655-1929(+)
MLRLGTTSVRGRLCGLTHNGSSLLLPQQFYSGTTRLTHDGSSFRVSQQFYSGTTEQNKVAIIFGVDEHGFGQGVARRFAANGFKVTLIGRSPLVEETSRKIFDENNGESLTVIPMETETSVDFVKNAFVQTQERAGPPSFVLYNAIDLNRSRRLSNVSFLDKVSQEELQRSLDEHLKGAHLVAKEALELFSNKKKGTLAFSNTPLEITLVGRSSLVEEASRKIFEENNGESLTVIPMETETTADFIKNSFVQTQERAGLPSFVLYNTMDLNRSRRLSKLSFLDQVSQEEVQTSLNEHLKGAHLVAKEALELFSNKKAGTLVFSNTPLEIPAPVPVSLVRHAIRGMSLSLAREFGPKGVHVIHVAVDEGIEPRKELFEIKPADVVDQFLRPYDSSSILDPLKVADSLLFFHAQTKECWTNEVEFR